MLLQMAGFLSFSWLNNIHVCVCIYIKYFLYPFIFQWKFTLLYILAIVNDAETNIGVHMFFKLNFSDALQIVGLQDLMETLFLVFEVTPRYFP